jgi:hypothetical protein
VFFKKQIINSGGKMLNSGIVDVAIGLSFCYAAVALFVSVLMEAVASALKLRSKTLLDGVKTLLNDKDLTGLAKEIYNHGLVNPLSNGVLVDSTKLPKVLPSYIASSDFANALIDRLKGTAGDLAALKDGINRINDPQIKEVLTGFMNRADDKIEVFHQQTADWFDHAMDRVSGGYKRKTQLITFVSALFFAFIFQIDSIYLFQHLWEHQILMGKIASASQDVANSAKIMDALNNLPLGFFGAASRPQPSITTEYLWSLVPALPGLFLTATAALFGAPFWFDVLQRLIQIRGTGTKPPADKDNDKVKVAATP